MNVNGIKLSVNKYSFRLLRGWHSIKSDGDVHAPHIHKKIIKKVLLFWPVTVPMLARTKQTFLSFLTTSQYCVSYFNILLHFIKKNFSNEKKGLLESRKNRHFNPFYKILNPSCCCAISETIKAYFCVAFMILFESKYFRFSLLFEACNIWLKGKS